MKKLILPFKVSRPEEALAAVNKAYWTDAKKSGPGDEALLAFIEGKPLKQPSRRSKSPCEPC